MKKTIRFQKMKFLLLILLITMTSLTGAQVAAQQARKVTGTVIDAINQEPIVGVTVLVKGTTTGTTTDLGGKYTIEVSDANAVLVFSFIGYASQSLVIGNNTTLDVQMALEYTGLEEIIVTGYSTTVRKNLTSAVASADVGSMQKRAVPDVAQALQGTVAGVNIVATNGDPGSEMDINIRGLSSYSGDNTPLILVDGVQVEGGLSLINSNDIASIQVLKDAASAAIYGSRAANGVILVATKKGEKSSKATITYQDYFGTQQPYKGISVCNSKEYITILQRMYGNDLSGAVLPPQAALDYIANPGNFKDYDWQKELIKAAPMQSHDLSVSGGGSSGTYRISTGYVNQQGITLGTGYERANVRANSEFIVNDNIKVGQSLAYATSSTKTEPYAFTRSVLQQALKMYPYFSPKLPNGDWQTSSFYYGGGDNPEALIRNPLHYYYTFWDGTNKNSEISMNMYAEIKIFKGLSYKINGAYSQINGYYSTLFKDKGQFQDEYFDANKSLNVSESKNFNWNIDNLLRYKREFGKHNVDVTVGYVAQKFVSSDLGGYKENFLSASTTTLNGPGGKSASTWGGKQESSLLSIISQAFYSYNDRYLITINFRRDGSSRFGPDYRWGNFPGASLGWRLSNENFWKNIGLATVINDFKIRAGYGQLGRQNLGNYDWIPVLEYNPVVFGESVQDGLIVGTPINQQISWETLISKTIGVDFELFKGKVSGSFDYYNNDSRNMIIGVAIAPSVGGGQIQSNAGDITNKGFEITLNHKNKIGELSYNVGFNLSTTKTRLVNFGRDIATGDWFAQPEWDTEHVTELHKGGGLSEYWLIKTDGLFRSQKEIDNYKSSDGTVIQPNAKPGDIKFIDYNDDGEISSDGDRQYCGTGVPKVNIGFNLSAKYKNFDLHIGSTGSFGQVIYNVNQYMVDKNNEYSNFGTSLLGAYDEVTNPNSDFPRLNPYDAEENNNSRATSNRYIENGSYMKIRDVELGYTLPVSVANRVKMSSARVFVRAQNLVTFTRYTGIDPEIGSSPIVDPWVTGAPTLFTAGLDRDTAPQARSFQIGVNITF